MAKDPFEQFAIPNEVRAFAEQSVTQARKAFEGFIQAANQAIGQFQGQALTAGDPECTLAHYHPNDPARRMYLRLGYRTIAQNYSTGFH